MHEVRIVQQHQQKHRNFLFDHPHFPLGYAYSLVFLAAAAACVVVLAAAAAAAGCVFSWTIYRALSRNRSVALELQFHTDSSWLRFGLGRKTFAVRFEFASHRWMLS